MSDPVPDKLRPRPRRAEPMQPDKPSSGGDAPPPEEPAARDDKQDALIRGGYAPGKST